MKFMYKEFCNLNKTENKFDFCVYSRLYHKYMRRRQKTVSSNDRQLAVSSSR